MGLILGDFFSSSIGSTSRNWAKDMSNNLQRLSPSPTQPIQPDPAGTAASLIAAGLLGTGGGLKLKHLLDSHRRTMAPATAGPHLIQAFLGGTAIGGVGSILGRNNQCQEKIDSVLELHEEHVSAWNSTVVQLNAYHNETLNEKEKQYDEKLSALQQLLSAKDLHLNETTLELRDLKDSHKQQYNALVCVSGGLLGVAFILLIVCLIQSIIHNRERHRLAVAHHMQYEISLKDKLHEQHATIAEQKKLLEVAIEEKERYQRSQYNLQWMPPSHHPSSAHHHGNQSPAPVILTLPPNLIASSTASTVASTATTSTEDS